MTAPNKIVKSDGITPAEKYLQKLCERSFLSLWSYAGIYRDQGNPGKEICDLLVIFDDHLIIFSDKDCEFPNTGDLQIDWDRWYKKAIKKSADQIWGAERWLLSHPDRVFLNDACTIPFPIDIPRADKAKVHRIVVAHSVSERCAQELGGNGSLMIVSDYAGIPRPTAPFTIGQPDPTKGFVHILDDTTLDIVLNTLDTVSDFVAYLAKKERAFTNGTIIQAAGEEELVAFYLTKGNKDGERDFVLGDGVTNLSNLTLTEGLWETFSSSPQRKRQIEADKVSYAWDALIEKFSHHALNGTSYYNYPGGIDDTEKILRFMARESRTRRRGLAERLLSFVRQTPRNMRATRTMVPSKAGDPYYVFFVLPLLSNVSYQEYRDIRRGLLESHCMITKLNFPDAQDIIGIATESGRTMLGSEDAVYYDAKEWNEDQENYAKQMRTELTQQGLIGTYKQHSFVEKEYPDRIPSLDYLSNKDFVNTKGRSRNLSCPCGSGRKFKKCCASKL